MPERELLFVSVDGWLVKIQNAVKFLKNILFVTYIKNKGIRRICFMIGFGFLVYYSALTIHSFYTGSIDKSYKNLEDANADIYYSHKYDMPYWYRKNHCMAIHLKKYNISSNITFVFNTYENILESSEYGWCAINEKDCNILKAIKDDPIHLKCNGWEDENKSTLEQLFIILSWLLMFFYLPFIIVCILKMLFNIFKWVLRGFMEKEL